MYYNSTLKRLVIVVRESRQFGEKCQGGARGAIVKIHAVLIFVPFLTSE